MPLYEYQCTVCGHRFEVIQKFSDRPVKKCPQCGKAVERLVSSPAIQFKGTGWYVTDYAKRSGPLDSKSESADGQQSAKEKAAASDKSEKTTPPAKHSTKSSTAK